MPKNLNKLSDDDVKCILQEYPLIDEVDFKIELQKWKKRTHNAESSLEDCIRQTKDVLPNLHTVFVVFLTMPVSMVSAERSFSALKRLKTYLRNTTGQERMTALALLHIHSQKTVDIEQILRNFDSSEHRLRF